MPQESVKEVTPISVKSTRRGRGFWTPWIAAAAMAIAAISLGVQNRALNDELQDESRLVTNLAGQASRAQQVLEVLTAPSAQRVILTEGKAVPAPTARATYLPDRGGLILLATNLKPLPRGQDLRALADSGEWQSAGARRTFPSGCCGYGNPGAPVAYPRHRGQGLWGDDRECGWSRCSNLSHHSLRSSHRELGPTEVAGNSEQRWK